MAINAARLQELQRITEQQGRRITLKEWTDYIGGGPEEFHKLYGGPDNGQFIAQAQAHATRGTQMPFEQWIELGGDPAQYTLLYGVPPNPRTLSPLGIRVLQGVQARGGFVAAEGTATKDTKIGQPREIFAPQMPNAPTVEAGQIGPVERVNAPNIGATERASAAQVAPVGPMQTAQVGPASQVGLDGYSREQQVALANALRATMEGRGPSLAELQLQEATDRSIGQEMGVIASQRGLSAGLAARLAGNQAMSARQEAGRQAAQLRLAEAIQAQQGLGAVLGQLRGADISVEQGNQAATNAMTVEQARLSQQAGATNQQAALAQAIRQAELAQQVALANSQASNQRQTDQAELATRASLSNQLAANTQSYNQAQLVQQANQSTAQFGLDRDKTQSQLEQQANMANQQGVNTANIQQGVIAGGVKQASLGANATISAAAAAAEAAIRVQQLENEIRAFEAAVKGNDENDDKEQGGNAAGEDAVGDTINDQDQQDDAGTGPIVQGASGGTGLGATGGSAPSTPVPVGSDERMKKNVKPAGERTITDFLDTLRASSFEYKDSDKGAGKQVGIMAQDVEKSKTGKPMVVDTPEGKYVDFGRGLAAILAAQANLNDRVKKMEGRR